jgi:putative ABC transport system substrate-binding protein
MSRFCRLPCSLLIGLLLWGAVTPAAGAEAAQATGPVVVVSSSTSDSFQQVEEGFWQVVRGCRPDTAEIGYALGPEPVAQQEIMTAIGANAPGLIFALGARATQEVQAAWPQRPLVATMVLDERLFTLGGQTTGVSLRFPAEVHLDWLRRILPEARQVYLLYDPAENAAVPAEIKKAAQRHPGMEIHGLAVESVSQLPAALKAVGRRADVLLGLADATVYSGKTATAVLLTTFQDRVPFAGLSRSWVKAGALYALERDYRALGRQCGAMACRILAGTEVAAIPPTTPEAVRCIVNMKTAKHLRLTINAAVLDEAAEVFE